MAYVFNRETASTFKIPKASVTDGQALTLKGVSAQTASADSIVAGVAGLLYIANRQNDYDFDDGVRVVNEDVDEQ